MRSRSSWLGLVVAVLFLAACDGGTPKPDAGGGGGSGGGGAATGGGSGGGNVTGGGGGGSVQVVATKLAFHAPNLAGVAGQPLGPSLEVHVTDATGAIATGSVAMVSLVLETSPMGAQLGGTLTVQAVDGVATFTDARLQLAGTGYSLRASSAGLTDAVSATFEVIPAVPAKLAFIDQPEPQASVRAPLGRVQVAVLDAFDNRTTSTPAVTVSAPGLTGTLTHSALNGVATFEDLSVTDEGTALRLTATATDLASDTSAAFVIVDDVPPTQPVLMQGAATTTSVTVSWTAVGDDGALGPLTSHELRYATSTITTDADFANATVVTTGAPQAPGITETYTISGLSPSSNVFVALKVTDSAGNSVRSATLPVSTTTPTVTQLAFTAQPASGTAGMALPTVRVALRDAQGATVTSATTAVTLTVPALGGFTPVTVNAVAGIATFSGLRVDTAGTGYQLRAAAGSLTPVLSSAFDIAAGAASTLTVTGLPASVVAGVAQTLTVTARDAFGNVAPTYTGTVSFTSTDPGALLPANLSFVTGDQGTKSVSGIQLRTAGPRAVTVTDSAMPSIAATVSTTVSAAAAASLTLTGLPASVTAGSAQTLTVTLRDAFGNVATGYTGTIAVTSTDTAAQLPANTVFTAMDNGVKSVSVQLRTAGARSVTVRDTVTATLTATANTTVTVGAASTLVFTQQPANGRVRAPLGAVTVAAQDGFGNAVTSTAPVTVALSQGNAAAVLSGTLTATPASGTATFSDLSVSDEGTGFVLVASAAGLSNATSSAFTILDDVAPAAPVLDAGVAPGPATAGFILSWTEVGDDGQLGTVATRELRYSTTPMTTDAEFAAGTLVTTPAPAAAGTTRTVTLAVSNATAYYFRLRVADGAGNVAWSNQPRVGGDPCAGITCTPPAAGCSANGRSIVTYTSACALGTCQDTPTVQTTCQSYETCSAGACVPMTASAQQGRVLLNEFSALGTEFIELLNTTASAIDMRGYTLRNAAGQEVTIVAPTDPSGAASTPVLVPAGGVLHGVANPAGAVQGSPGFLYGAPGTTFALNDTGDALALYGTSGAVEDAVDFRRFLSNADIGPDAGTFVGFSGSSTQLSAGVTTAAANDVATNWCVSFFPAPGQPRVRVQHTMGAPNGSCGAVVINEALIDLTGADDAKSFIELAGPGGAVVGGMRLLDLEGVGTSAGALNVDGDLGTGETDGEFIIPAGTRIPADGVLLVADATSTNTTLVPGFVAGADVLARDMDMENSGGDSIQLVAVDGGLVDALGHEGTGATFSTLNAFNGLPMYETAAALYPAAPVGTAQPSLARSPTSADSNNNRADFRADPTPTPGSANDTISFAVAALAPNETLANVAAGNTIVTGTDFTGGLRAQFGAATPTNCTVSSPTQAVCPVPLSASVARVDVTLLPHASVVAPDAVLPASFTYTGVRNGTGIQGQEADYCALQFPAAFTVPSGTMSNVIYVRVYQSGVTEPAGAPAGLIASIGWGALNTNPTTTNWRWLPASFNTQIGNDDEFMGTFQAPVVNFQTQYAYTGRVSLDNGLTWTYCDLNGAGRNAGLLFEPTQLGVATITP